MSQDYKPGDYLIFQVEAAFGLMRLLEIERTENDTIWHIAAFEDMYLDTDMADAALTTSDSLKLSLRHAALTNRAFEATQTSRMSNKPLTESDLKPLLEWKSNQDREISDRTVRLLLGLR